MRTLGSPRSLLLVAILPACLTALAPNQMSTQETRVELSIERAWTADDGGIEIQIEASMGESGIRELRGTVTRAEIPILRLPRASPPVMDPSILVPPQSNSMTVCELARQVAWVSGSPHRIDIVAIALDLLLSGSISASCGSLSG